LKEEETTELWNDIWMAIVQLLQHKTDIEENFTNDQYSNPLQWWRRHVEKYPNIWKLASIILAIPATSAPSERVFGTAANIINKKRVRLKPETLDALIFLRGNKEFVTWN
jgi:hypothetical protein